MRSFDYEVAPDPASAIALLTERPDAALLGGGTNLIDLMKLGVARPGAIIDVNRLGLDRVESLDDGGLLIGASVRNSVLAADDAVRARFPVLSQALLAGASGQLRNMATTAGNLRQRTRCVYFQDVSKPCNKREPGSGCPAIAGDHRNLAILGTSDSCIATHPSDMAVAMTALNAAVVMQGPGGVREVPLDDFHLLPGDTPDREQVIAHDEIITGVRVPALPLGAVSTYRKVRDRASYAFALSSVAAVLDLDADGLVRDVRIGLGGVAPKPWRARRAEQALRGTGLTRDAIGAAIDGELAAARALPDNAFKVPLVRQLVTTTLARLAGLEESS